MKKYVFVVSIVLSNCMNAQLVPKNILTDARTTYANSQPVKISKPLILIDGCLGNMQYVPSESIESVSIYKSKNTLPKELEKFSDFVENGIILMKTKGQKMLFKTVVLADLNKKYGLPENQPIYYDNLKISDPTTKVIEELLKNIRIKDENGEKFLMIYSTPEINPENKL